MTTLVYDLVPPRRVSLADLGGGQKENDPDWAPDPSTGITADEVNQTALVLQRLESLAPAARVVVHVAAGAASVTQVQALSTGAHAPTLNVLSSAFNATRQAAGKYLVTADAGSLPSSGMPPRVSVIYDGSSSALYRLAQCAQAADGVRVQVFDLTGAYQDCDFVLELF